MADGATPTMIEELWTRIILESFFILGSIITLYCLFILWARVSYRNSKKPEE
jgi:hypothetical protein|tara:strand:- start:270 stop:425 length:156 start_codon:yes stop_codon:yes gene_type:complete